MTSPAAKTETPLQAEYAASVDGACHASAYRIIGTLDEHNATLAEQVAQWRGKHNEVLHENDTLRRALQLYRDSHNYCIESEPQWRCNKCKFADACLAAISGTEG